ncbi:MAG: malate synthase A [Caulobacterales bacterium]|nr:malate synthase A [Caulobacterales bacterium]
MTATIAAPAGVSVLGPVRPGYEVVLTSEALAFIAELERRFGARRTALLAARAERQKAYDAGENPVFPDASSEARSGDWRVRPAPADLQDRRVEITGPVDRKMIINALNSGAKCFMADFEDASTPSWSNMVEGQVNLRDATRRTIALDDAASGKSYRLNPQVATLIVRPRGWHLEEAHVTVDGRPLSGGLFDFGMYLFHNWKSLRDINSGPYYYLPKMESGEEAALWSDVFSFAEDTLGLERGTCRATVLIETLPATFQLDEILFALKDHITALNCGRWDYIFSYVKRFKKRGDLILPERGQVTMTAPFMRAYSRLVIETCHKRGAHAMGGMSAFIPVKGDEAANDKAFAQLTADKTREAGDGHDGTWVAHPGMVAQAKKVFDELMPTANQVSKTSGFAAAPGELIAQPDGSITEAGVRNNTSVGVQYIASWLRGQGAAPINNLMEDAATAEIARAQLWQWRVHGAALDDGRPVTEGLLTSVFDEELGKLVASFGQATFDEGRFAEAGDIMQGLIFDDAFEEFLTLPAYERIKEIA